MTRPLPLVSAMLATALVVAGLCLGGCSAPLRPYQPAPNPLAVDAAEYDRIYQATIAVLRDRGFHVDREDYRFGAVTTHPLESPTVAEPWRRQNTTLAQAVESTLNHVRRQVTVTLEPLSAADEAALDDPAGMLEGAAPAAAAADDAPPEEPDTYLLRVEVVTQNQQIPLRRLTMAAQSQRYSNLESVPQEWQERGILPSYWVTTGRDPHLEQRLLREIVERSMRIPEPMAARNLSPLATP